MNDGQGDPLPVFIGAASLEIGSERARAGDDTIMDRRGGRE